MSSNKRSYVSDGTGQISTIDLTSQNPDLEQFRNPFHEVDFDTENSPKTQVELYMMNLSSVIRSKSKWFEKMNDETIRNKWKQEALEESYLSEKEINYVLAELEYYNSIRDGSIEMSTVDGVWQSDELISSDIKQSLIKYVKKLEDISEKDKDWHPGTNQQILDLVHPSLFSYVNQITRISNDTIHVDNALESIGNGQIIDININDLSQRDKQQKISSDYTKSDKYQWLPAEFNVSKDGQVKIESYINNLHPTEHKDLYLVIEQIFQRFIPLFNKCLTDLLYEKPNRINVDFYASSNETMLYADEDDEDGEDDDDDDNNDNDNSNRVTISDLREFEMPSPITSAIDLRGRKLQVIVKLASIILTVDNPKYPGGVWHVEGMENEHIVSTVGGKIANSNEVAPRSASVDSAIFDGAEDSPDEILDGEEESFDELNEDNQQNGQCKALQPRLIRYGSKRVPIIQFSPKVVYGRCPEARKIGEKHSLTFKFVKNETKLIRNILEGHGFREVHPSSSEFNIMWTGGGMKPFTLRSLNPHQRVNHFPRSYEMTRKDRLYKNVQKMQQEKGVKNFNFIPTTFLLPYEFEDFSAAFQREKGIWIIKPVASSQGKGIFLINHPDQVPLDENLVISRYIDNPLLIDGYKFDVRIYVAVTSYDPLVAYLYEEGLTRFATVKYDPNCRNIKNAFMHLTNYSVNKRSHRYVRCDDPDIEDFGNKWSMSAMLRLLKSEGKDTFSLMMSIEDVVIKTLLSVESQISAACRMFLPTRGNCFEVYGFDILIDDELKPWVLEVNLSPSLGCDAPIDLKIKTHMICDLLNLSSIPCTDPAIYSNKQRQQKNDANCQSEQLKRRRPISAGYSLTSSLTSQSSNNNRVIRATTANRPTRLGNANNNNNNNQVNDMNRGEYFGLTSEEIRILRTIKEETRQRGGFVRIFPTGDTFEFFSSFFEQRTTSFNQMIHQRLYPSRWTQNTLNCQQNSSQIRRTTVPRAKHLSSAFNYGHSSDKDLTPKTSGCDLDEALERYRIYQRRLIDIVPPTTTNNHFNDTQKSPEKSSIVIENVEQNQINLHRTTSAPIHHSRQPINNKSDSAASKRLTSVTQLVKQQQFNVNPAPGEGRHSIYAKNDILQMLNQGLTLSALQARTAFGTYLQRIQFRLMLDSELKEDVTSTQHMELVIRFLKRAGQNLSPPFRVEIPSRRLSQSDQKRILAKELCDFLHLYNKETVLQYQNDINLTNQIDNRLFENFLRSASEADLEQMMTTYMKNNPNSAIHLGVNPKINKNNNNSNQQGSDVGPDQQAQTILPKQSIEEKTITLIQTISSNEQSNQKWATLSTQSDPQKRLLRASSASRHRNNKRHDDIYKLYGVSRPVSAVVQQRNKLTATGSLVPGTKLLTRERPNSANFPADQEEKKDFVEQLNELSSKQHRRQYSGLTQLNAFHSRSSSVEPQQQQQQTNIQIKNDCETASQTTTKEEDILEKSRQMLEESKAKNEQLAEQAKVFQRTLQRNEIYSALNRYSQRPPIYPSLTKDMKSSSNRFQQLKSNATISLINDQHRVKSTNSSQD